VVDNEQTLTNAAGIALASNTVSKTVGKQEPLLLEDYRTTKTKPEPKPATV
jgi:catalase